jgi:hypothetical protein
LLHALCSMHRMMRAHAGGFRSWLLLFYIWAGQWMLNGAAKWYFGWKLPGWLQPSTALAAALASIVILLAANVRSPAGSVPPAIKLASLIAVVPFCIASGALLLLEYVHAVDPFFMDLFRTLLLAFFFSCLGVLLGLELVFLGVWMFFLCVVICVWYLGFAPMVLEFMGGLGLLACGLILTRWTRPKAGKVS